MAWGGSAISDEVASAILGPKCPECGHRSEDASKHRPAIGDWPACSHWTPAPAHADAANAEPETYG